MSDSSVRERGPAANSSMKLSEVSVRVKARAPSVDRNEILIFASQQHPGGSSEAARSKAFERDFQTFGSKSFEASK